MAMTAEEIASHPALERCVRGQALTLLSMQETSPRIASVFATQQRWLMAHAALAQYFRNEAGQTGSGLLAERFVAVVVEHNIASRNTASAFLKEMLKYEIVSYLAGSTGRGRPFEPAPAVLMALFQWHVLHLSTLDGLDGGGRVVRFHASPGLLRNVQPLIADGLIGSGDVREPEKTFSLFTWINEGGIVMDRLMAGCGEGGDDGLRILTDITSISQLADGLRLSRTQLSRKFAEAEAMEASAGPERAGARRCGCRQIFAGNITPRRRPSLRSSTPRSRRACEDDRAFFPSLRAFVKQSSRTVKMTLDCFVAFAPRNDDGRARPPSIQTHAHLRVLTPDVV